MVLAWEASLCASPVPCLHHTLPPCSFLPPHAHRTHGIAWLHLLYVLPSAPCRQQSPGSRTQSHPPIPPIPSILPSPPSFHPLHPFVPPTPPSLHPSVPSVPSVLSVPFVLSVPPSGTVLAARSRACFMPSALLLHTRPPFPPDRPPCSSVW